jgi:hypothetical protein
MARTFKVKVESAFAVGGVVHRRGETAEVDEKMAKSLLRRGKATLAEGKAPAKGDGSVGTDGKGGAKQQGKAPANKAPEDEG